MRGFREGAPFGFEDVSSKIVEAIKRAKLR